MNSITVLDLCFNTPKEQGNNIQTYKYPFDIKYVCQMTMKINTQMPHECMTHPTHTTLVFESLYQIENTYEPKKDVQKLPRGTRNCRNDVNPIRVLLHVLSMYCTSTL